MEIPAISSSCTSTLSNYGGKISLSQFDENRDHFNLLAKSWRKESMLLSSTHEIINCPSCQKIIQMGPVAILFIIEELRKGNRYGLGHWSHSLEVLTGENPVRPEHKGNIQAIADAWIAWFEHGR